jgi:hypothetical protein
MGDRHSLNAAVSAELPRTCCRGLETGVTQGEYARGVGRRRHLGVHPEFTGWLEVKMSRRRAGTGAIGVLTPLA